MDAAHEAALCQEGEHTSESESCWQSAFVSFGFIHRRHQQQQQHNNANANIDTQLSTMIKKLVIECPVRNHDFPNSMSSNNTRGGRDGNGREVRDEHQKKGRKKGGAVAVEVVMVYGW